MKCTVEIDYSKLNDKQRTPGHGEWVMMVIGTQRFVGVVTSTDAGYAIVVTDGDTVNGFAEKPEALFKDLEWYHVTVTIRASVI